MSNQQSSEAIALYKKTDELADKILSAGGRETEELEKMRRDWAKYVASASSVDLIYITSLLTSDENHLPAIKKALREAIIAQIAHQNSKGIIETMTKLDKVSSRLTFVSLVLAGIAVFLAIVQILQGFKILN